LAIKFSNLLSVIKNSQKHLIEIKSYAVVYTENLQIFLHSTSFRG